MCDTAEHIQPERRKVTDVWTLLLLVVSSLCVCFTGSHNHISHWITLFLSSSRLRNIIYFRGLTQCTLKYKIYIREVRDI